MLGLFKRKRVPTAAMPPGRRAYAIGDVHGRLDLLERLIAQIAVDAAERGVVETDLILLGDLIDRGPESASVVEVAMAASGDSPRVTVLKGNHEAMLGAILAGETRRATAWLQQGGREALESFGVDSAALDEADGATIARLAQAAIRPEVRAWLEALPLYRQIGDYLFVHAGIRPGVPIAEQVEDDLLWIRGEFLDSREDHGLVVVHGHTPRPRVVERANRIGIDTGAYYSDRLTALGLEGTDRWYLSTAD